VEGVHHCLDRRGEAAAFIAGLILKTIQKCLVEQQLFKNVCWNNNYSKMFEFK
jgi:hypothetical protein